MYLSINVVPNVDAAPAGVTRLLGRHAANGRGLIGDGLARRLRTEKELVHGRWRTTLRSGWSECWLIVERVLERYRSGLITRPDPTRTLLRRLLQVFFISFHSPHYSAPGALRMAAFCDSIGTI